MTVRAVVRSVPLLSLPTASMPPAAPSSSARALNAILPQNQASPYEAHQKARTFASRYVKSNQFDTAIDVLFQSSRELLKTGQAGSGVDLASFLLDVYETKGEKVTDESRGEVLCSSTQVREV
jgi:golgi to ER traffic protein 4